LSNACKMEIISVLGKLLLSSLLYYLIW
jgi:hypothetical protein